jgi:CheY-like chemotaxis protein
LSKRLAQLLGGDVSLKQSYEGGGSTFLITVDPGDISILSPDILPNADKKLPYANGFRLQGMRVLLVEDSLDNQRLVAKILQTSGAEVEVVGNGRRGVDSALAGDFDVVLMDIQMPLMDGYEATGFLRKEGYSRPIFALTAHAMKEHRDKCAEIGFNGLISKPVDRELLVRGIESVRQGIH